MNATNSAPAGGAKKKPAAKKATASAKKTSAPANAAPATPEVAPPAPQAAYVGPQPMLETDARSVSMLVHLLSAIAALISAGTLGFVAPLVLWLIYRERSALVDHQGKQNLNLQLTVLTLGAGAWILGFLLFFGLGWFLTLPLWGLYVLYAIIISFVAAMRAQGGEYYRIPLAIPFIR